MDSFDVTKETLISQYAAPQVVIPALIDSWAAATVTSMEGAFSAFLSDYWDINTAVDGGLDNWGVILGVSRYLTLPIVGAYVGFYNTDDDYVPMSQGPLYAGGPIESSFALTDAAYRTLLLAKALANISGCSIQSLNRLAQAVFGTGAMYVVDFGGMQMEYVFAAAPTSLQQAIAQNSGVLPHPTGVGSSIHTAILSNALLVAGTSGSDIGYGASFGSLTPDVDVNGNDVTELFYSAAAGGTLVFQITSTASLLIETESGVDIETESGTDIETEASSDIVSNYFTYLFINGVFLLRSAASFSMSSGVATWTWTGISSTVSLAAPNIYTILVI